MMGIEEDIKLLLEIEELKGWGDELLKILAHLDSLDFNSVNDNGFFFYPLSEENILLFLDKKVDQSEKKLHFFEQVFTEYMKKEQINAVYHTGINPYKHKYYKCTGEKSEIYLLLSPTFKNFLKSYRPSMSTIDYEPLFKEFIEKIGTVKDLLYFNLVINLLRNCSKSTFYHDFLKNEVSQDFLQVKKMLLDKLNEYLDLNTYVIDYLISEISINANDFPCDPLKYLSNFIAEFFQLPDTHFFYLHAHGFNAASCRIRKVPYFEKRLSSYFIKTYDASREKIGNILRITYQMVKGEFAQNLEHLAFLQFLENQIKQQKSIKSKTVNFAPEIIEHFKDAKVIRILPPPNDSIVLSMGFTIENLRDLIKQMQPIRPEFVRTWLSMEIDAQEIFSLKISHHHEISPPKRNEIGFTENITEEQKKEIILFPTFPSSCDECGTQLTLETIKSVYLDKIQCKNCGTVIPIEFRRI